MSPAHSSFSDWANELKDVTRTSVYRRRPGVSYRRTGQAVCVVETPRANLVEGMWGRPDSGVDKRVI